MITVETSSVSETHALASALAKACVPGDCILLHGELGAGKTEFTRGFIRALQTGTDEVTSPTFTLAQSYPAKGGHAIWHFDLYRLDDPSQLIEIGLEEALESGITLIEWPELAQNLLPYAALEVRIAHGASENERRFSLRGSPEIWDKRLHAIEKDIHGAR